MSFDKYELCLSTLRIFFLSRYSNKFSAEPKCMYVINNNNFAFLHFCIIIIHYNFYCAKFHLNSEKYFLATHTYGET